MSRKKLTESSVEITELQNPAPAKKKVTFSAWMVGEVNSGDF